MEELNRQRRLTEGTSGLVVSMLRRGAMTIDELAAALDLTRTAVRAQLATLQQQGSVEVRGHRPGVSKPARTYAVTRDAEQLLSRAYVPVLKELLRVLAGRMPQRELESVLREVGRGLRGDRGPAQGGLRERVEAASELLNELGGVTEVESNGHFIIRGHGCPISAATAEHPEVCSAIETLLSDLIGERVTQRCERDGDPRCCFEIDRRKAPRAERK